MSLGAVSGNIRPQLERRVGDSAQGLRQYSAEIEEERSPRCIWVGMLGVHGESCEPGTQPEAEGKVCIQVETYLRLEVPKNTY